MRDLLIRPRDPLIFRDARPFSADPGARAESLRWPLPTTLAGALRTLYGTAQAFTTADDWTAALALETQGPFLLARHADGDPWTFFAPAPRDAVPYTDDAGVKRMMMLWPDRVAVGNVSLPAGGGAMAPMRVDADVKPDGGLDYWSWPDIVPWLASADTNEWLDARKRSQHPNSQRPEWTLAHIPRETRVHVSIDPKTQAAREGMLFTTIGLAFRNQPGPWRDEPAMAMLARCHLPGKNWEPVDALFPFGGERRLAALETAATDLPDLGVDSKTVVEAKLLEKLTQTNKLRLLLLSPALFENGGWRPDLSSHGLTLVGAAIDRRVPVSGWNMAARGEKATRYAVPAGGVYFFETTSGDNFTPEQIKQFWFTSISDDDQAKRDGYGLVLPGVWKEGAPTE